MSEKKEYRPRLTPDEMDAVLRFRGEVKDSDSDSNEYQQPKVLSAWGIDGKLMNIDEYCSYHKLPRQDVSSYKLVAHTGTPYYNMVFRETKLIEEVDFKEIIDSIVRSKYKRKSTINLIDEEVTRLIYTDTHIAMCTDIEGTSMYATDWNENALMETLDIMCEEVIKNRVGDILIIDDLGDFLDGWNGQTTRGGHQLPQNMTNKEAFRVGLKFKVDMIDKLLPYFNKIICNSVCIDNHSGDFSGILNHAFKRIVESDEVIVNNLEKFIEHYLVGKHAFVLSHGKDHKSLKFGFKPKLDSVQVEKIDHYLKHNENGSIFKKADFIWFDKGDSHQMLFDYATAADFNYMNYPALSPSSEWIQTNFKKGERGFVIQQINPDNKNIKIIPIII